MLHLMPPLPGVCLSVSLALSLSGLCVLCGRISLLTRKGSKTAKSACRQRSVDHTGRENGRAATRGEFPPFAPSASRVPEEADRAAWRLVWAMTDPELDHAAWADCPAFASLSLNRRIPDTCATVCRG